MKARPADGSCLLAGSGNEMRREEKQRRNKEKTYSDSRRFKIIMAFPLPHYILTVPCIGLLGVSSPSSGVRCWMEG